MKGKSHEEVTRQAFNLYKDIYGVTPLYWHRETVAEEADDTDDYRDVELINVESGRDNPHEDAFWDDDDEAHYTRGSNNFTAFNHFIDIKKGAGSFDDYDGYSYKHGSASSGEYQSAADAARGTLEWVGGSISGYKVDEGINWWYNDEYVHAPGREWYNNCSPALWNYCYYQALGKYTSKETELAARFPLANSTGSTNKGIPYSVFMPVDNLARYWYSEFTRTSTARNLGPVMHAIQDADIPHHAAGYLGNWHSEYEDAFRDYISEHYDDATNVAAVKALVAQWDRIDASPPSQLGVDDFDLVPARNWSVEMLVTWVALNACDEYVNTYNNFSYGFSVSNNSMKKLMNIAIAMGVLLLVKANEVFVPQTGSFIGNKRSMELHRQSCYWVGQMIEHHKVPFTTIEAALTQGYNGCYYCLRQYDTG